MITSVQLILLYCQQNVNHANRLDLNETWELFLSRCRPHLDAANQDASNGHSL